jgi:hypothetical protein
MLELAGSRMPSTPICVTCSDPAQGLERRANQADLARHVSGRPPSVVRAVGHEGLAAAGLDAVAVGLLLAAQAETCGTPARCSMRRYSSPPRFLVGCASVAPRMPGNGLLANKVLSNSRDARAANCRGSGSGMGSVNLTV